MIVVIRLLRFLFSLIRIPLSVALAVVMFLSGCVSVCMATTLCQVCFESVSERMRRDKSKELDPQKEAADNSVLCGQITLASVFAQPILIAIMAFNSQFSDVQPGFLGARYMMYADITMLTMVLIGAFCYLSVTLGLNCLQFVVTLMRPRTDKHGANSNEEKAADGILLK